jgi:hypothetical protein
MGSKTIIFLGVLISAVYLYFCISKYTVVESKTDISSSSVVQAVDEIKPEIIDEAPSIEEDDAIQNANERISTPAFGFMAGINKNQIVALMSDNDENGSLSKQIEKLCEKKQCSKDMRYENDIIDASWQEDTAQIIELLTDGSIDKGSLFIEGNVLKLEGIVKSQKAQDRLNDILNSVKNDTFKVENYLKLSENIQKRDSKTKKEFLVEKTDIKKVDTKPIIKPKVKVEKVKPKDDVKEPTVSTPVVSTDSTMETTLDTQSKITVEHSVDEVIPAVGIVAKPRIKIAPTKKKSTKKRVVKTKPAPKPEVIPVPFMETTLDAETRVRAILSEIKDSKAEVGMVAKPHMETTIDEKDK